MREGVLFGIRESKGKQRLFPIPVNYKTASSLIEVIKIWEGGSLASRREEFVALKHCLTEQEADTPILVKSVCQDGLFSASLIFLPDVDWADFTKRTGQTKPSDEWVEAKREEILKYLRGFLN